MPTCPKTSTLEEQCSFTDSDGERCDREVLAKGLCWTHYQQQRRGRPLTRIRRRGLVVLAGNVRVAPEIAEILEQRVAQGLARSVYEATRQAVETGVACWEEEARQRGQQATGETCQE